MRLTKHTFFTFLAVTLFLTGCSGVKKTVDDDDILTREEARSKDLGKLFGDETFVFGPERESAKAGSTGIGVNSYLWRASLDTISFMPLQSADPFGGVIITDWHIPPHARDERLKVNVLILDRHLRADGVKVSVFRQKLIKGHWVDQKVETKTAMQLEDLILTRARQLRIDAGK